MITRHLFAPLRLLPTLVRHRFLLGQLAWRAFTVRHAGSYLGWLWTPLSTVIQFAIFVVVFSAILKIKIEGLGIDLARRPDVGFGVFLVTGLVPFLAVNDAVVRAARVFRAHVSLVQRVRMPLEVLVIGDMLGALLHHGLSMVVVMVYCAVKGHLALVNLPWLLFGLLLAAVWIVGLSLVASMLGALLPDIPELLTLLMQVAFYGAPIVYPLSMIHRDALRLLIEANPITPMIGVMRAGLIGSTPPPVAAMALLLAGGVALYVAGAAAMDRWRRTVPDIL